MLALFTYLPILLAKKILRGRAGFQFNEFNY